jgi:hypothetical protein
MAKVAAPKAALTRGIICSAMSGGASPAHKRVQLIKMSFAVFCTL